MEADWTTTALMEVCHLKNERLTVQVVSAIRSVGLRVKFGLTARDLKRHGFEKA
jgi:hypothetical protein